MNEFRKTFWHSAFAAMMTIWTYFEPTALRLAVWDDALSDLSVDQLILGVSYVVRNHSGNQPPTPGEVRDAILGPLTKCAHQNIEGKVTRWEMKRLAPPESTPLRALTHDHLRLSS